MSVVDLLSVVRPVAEALGVAHREGVIHRDVKPSNIMLVNDGRVVLLDFGVAKLTTRGERGITGVLAVGTPGFVAPEQLMGTAVDARADVFALGVTMFRALTREFPYDQLARVRNAPPPDVRRWRPDVPQEVASLIRRCIALSREERFASMSELGRELARVEQIVARSHRVGPEAPTFKAVSASKPTIRQKPDPQGPVAAATLPSPTASATTQPSANKPARHRSSIVVALALIAIIIVGVMMTVSFSGARQQASPRTESTVATPSDRSSDDPSRSSVPESAAPEGVPPPRAAPDTNRSRRTTRVKAQPQVPVQSDVRPPEAVNPPTDPPKAAVRDGVVDPFEETSSR
jgi:serine/threonine-protein kinase